MSDPRMHRCPTCGGLAAPPADPVGGGRPENIQALALREIAADLEGCHEDCWRFWRLILEIDKPYHGLRALTRDFGVTVNATLLSRFFRAALPSPAVIIKFVYLMRVAAVLEDRWQSQWDVVTEFGWPSTPHALNRLTRTRFGLSLDQFRAQETGRTMLVRIRRTVVIPHLDRWREFRPGAELPYGTPRRLLPKRVVRSSDAILPSAIVPPTRLVSPEAL